AEGDRLQSQHNEIESALEEILPAKEEDAKTVEQILDEWPRDGQPKRTALFDVLKKGHKCNKYKRLGEGKRGKPYRYCVSVPSVPETTVGTAGTETPTPSDEFAFCTHPRVGTETETVNAPGDATATVNPERSNKGPKVSLGTETEGGGYIAPGLTAEDAQTPFEDEGTKEPSEGFIAPDVDAENGQCELSRSGLGAKQPIPP